MSREEQLELARENVAWAAGRAAEYGVQVLVEAVNTFENGPYLLYTTRDAAAFVRSVGAANVGLQYDFYHMQRMEGNLSVNVREHIGELRGLFGRRGRRFFGAHSAGSSEASSIVSRICRRRRSTTLGNSTQSNPRSSRAVAFEKLTGSKIST